MAVLCEMTIFSANLKFLKTLASNTSPIFHIFLLVVMVTEKTLNFLFAEREKTYFFYLQRNKQFQQQEQQELNKVKDQKQSS